MLKWEDAKFAFLDDPLQQLKLSQLLLKIGPDKVAAPLPQRALRSVKGLVKFRSDIPILITIIGVGQQIWHKILMIQLILNININFLLLSLKASRRLP